MSALPSLSGKEVTRGFEKLGWVVARRKGSHIILTKDGEMTTLSMPIPHVCMKIPTGGGKTLLSERGGA